MGVARSALWMAGPAGSPGDVGMTKPNDNLQTQGNLRALMDSVGLWLFLFAAFALLTLSIGEKKIHLVLIQLLC